MDPRTSAPERLGSRAGSFAGCGGGGSEPAAKPTGPPRATESLAAACALEDPALAPAHLDAWLAWASRSKLKPFIKLARTIRRHREGILAAIRLGLTNGRLEGLNSRIRLISHRSFGFPLRRPLIALVYLCCAGITIDLPR